MWGGKVQIMHKLVSVAPSLAQHETLKNAWYEAVS